MVSSALNTAWRQGKTLETAGSTVCRMPIKTNNREGYILRAIILSALLLLCQTVSAETVQVKYNGAVSLDTFICSDVKEGSDVKRICYDKVERYMLIQLKATYYQYCSIDSTTVQNLQSASSKRQFFETRIRGSGSDGPFGCRTNPVPKKYRG